MNNHIYIYKFFFINNLIYRILIPERFIWFIFTQLILALHECHYGTKADGSPRPAILHR